MSHQIRIESKMTSKDLLKKALMSMGITNLKENTTLRSQHCDFVCDDAVGFAKDKSGAYSVVGDPYYSKGPLKKFYGKEKNLLRAVQEGYLMEQAKQDLAQAGFFLNSASKRQTKTGQTVMTATRM